MSRTGDQVQSEAAALLDSGGDRSLLSLIGEGLVSFGSGKPVTQLRNEAAIAQINQQQVQIGQQDLDAETRAVQRQQRQQGLGNEAFSGGPNSEQAAAQFAVEFPVEFEQISEAAGIRTQGQKTEAADFAVRLRATPFDQRQTLIDQRVTKLASVGRDPQHTASLTGLSEQDQNNAALIFELQALTPEERMDLATGAGKPAEQLTFEALIADFTPEEQNIARRVEAGLKARAGTVTGVERIATDVELTEQVAESKSVIREREKFAERTASSRAAAIDKGFVRLTSIDKNVRNLARAIAALDAGAETGPLITRLTPTIRAATTQLEQIQNELSLDVIGSVTFGALSEGELRLAQAVAIPTNLAPPELRAWLQGKMEAQQKLRQYFSEQIQFLDQGGSVAGFLRGQTRQAGDVTPTDTEELTPADLEFMTPEERALFQQ